ncbi:MAG: diacylglycerol kinase family protein [Clostridia bacterium]|nr:diacylglycerol kinase family protein [Clostridia bacterium]
MRSLLKSFHYAIRGIGFNLAYERNYRIHCFAALTVFLLAGLFYDFSSAEWGVLILLVTTVIAAESLNSAVEQTDNKITREQSRTIRHAKDSAASAVFVVAVGAVFVAFHLFWDLAVFAEIIAWFGVWYRLLGLALYLAVMLFFIFCKKTYKKDKK